MDIVKRPTIGNLSYPNVLHLIVCNVRRCATTPHTRAEHPIRVTTQPSTSPSTQNAQIVRSFRFRFSSRIFRAHGLDVHGQGRIIGASARVFPFWSRSMTHIDTPNVEQCSDCGDRPSLLRPSSQARAPSADVRSMCTPFERRCWLVGGHDMRRTVS